MGIVNPFTGALWTKDGDNIYRESLVGIGTEAPQRPLHVSGVAQVGDSTNPGDLKVYGSTGSTPSITVGLTDAGAGQDWQIQNTASNFTLAMGSGINPLIISNATGDATFTGNVDVESLTVDNITIDADDIILSSGPMTVQAQGGMTLASIDQSVVIETNAKVLFKKNGVEELDFSAGLLQFSNNQNSNLNLEETAHNVVGKDLAISSGDTTAGTTSDIAGGDLTLAGGRGKGSGNGGAIYLKTAPASTSGSTLNTLASAMTIKEGRVGIGTEVPNSGAILELASITQALILPRMNTTQRDAISGENGMLIYNTSTNKLNAFCNGSWEVVTSS